MVCANDKQHFHNGLVFICLSLSCVFWPPPPLSSFCFHSCLVLFWSGAQLNYSLFCHLSFKKRRMLYTQSNVQLSLNEVQQPIRATNTLKASTLWGLNIIFCSFDLFLSFDSLLTDARISLCTWVNAHMLHLIWNQFHPNVYKWTWGWFHGPQTGFGRSINMTQRLDQSPLHSN